MKIKQLLALSFIPFIASSCDYIQFVGELPEGIETLIPSSIVGTYEGDVINENGKNKAILRFNDDGTEEMDLSDGFNVASFVTGDAFSNTEFLISKWKYVGLFKAGIKVGNYASNLDGVLTFNFNYNVSAIRIKAKPRTSYSYGQDVNPIFNIDKDVKIRVNETKYIVINSNFDDETSVTYSTCDYVLGESSKSIQIRVNGQRAIISSVELFY